MPSFMMEGLLTETLMVSPAYELAPHLVPVLEMGPLGSFLKRPRLAPEGMATNIASLSAPQRRELETLFEKARALARRTGVALDLKASNLYWNGSTWQMFDVGARRSYRPYGYTTDLPDFATYLEVLRFDEPPDREDVRYRERLR